MFLQEKGIPEGIIN